MKLKTKDVEEHGQVLLVKLSGTKYKKGRSFTITPEYSELVKEYRKLRPMKTETDRFFLNYQRGKCTVQVIGKNKFSSMPKQIASFLKLENPDLYTGHAFRRTAAAIQKEVGSNILDLLPHDDNEINTSQSSQRTSGIQQQQIDNNLPSIKFQEVLIPYQEDSDADDYDDADEIAPLKQPKLEIDFELKDGNDPLEKIF